MPESKLNKTFESEDEKGYYYFQQLKNKTMSISKSIGEDREINRNIYNISL
jgi:hypothetical protein